jgi:pyridinium-3,5-biscarboxylic acid mononucleotide synthase
MTEQKLRELLRGVRQGRTEVEKAVEQLRHLPFEDLGFAKIDHHRELRHGMPEVILGSGKTPQQVAAIACSLLDRSKNLLVTRAGRDTYRAVKKVARAAEFFPLSGAIRVWRDRTVTGKGIIGVVCAGTSDIPVAEEAQVTAEVMGNRVETLYDVGVAGIHRLLNNRQRLLRARVIVCCAGMEGALPSVVGGLVSVPVIAVPTSVGYGASLHGVAALLGMLNSCASNVTVVNIDNGFGAGYVASMINRL